jgi:hypothetical protein
LRLEFEWLGRYVPVDVDSRDVRDADIREKTSGTSKYIRQQHHRPDATRAALPRNGCWSGGST